MRYNNIKFKEKLRELILYKKSNTLTISNSTNSLKARLIHDNGIPHITIYSYNTIIAYVEFAEIYPFKIATKMVIIPTAWDYSTTTSRHANMILSVFEGITKERLLTQFINPKKTKTKNTTNEPILALIEDVINETI